jgi:REP-associated tyrosine transposase
MPAHVTLRMRDDVPSLRLVPIVREVERTFARGCARPGFRLVHYSLQENHAHLIVEATDREVLGRGMKGIGARLARAVNRVTSHRGPVLFERYHLALLSTPKQVRNGLRYVLLNARHHVAGVRGAKAPARLDPASSARWFDGWNRKVLGAEDEQPPAFDQRSVASPRTWLLTVGWRRHGLIDPADVPGPSADHSR